MHAPDEALPADFGKYRLEKRIASGGMAEVFLAHRLDSPHEPLVIKRILPHISQDKSFVQMFTDEARMAANLNHPNVVRVLDLGLVDDMYFMAMEYVHGEDIRRIYNRAYKLQRSLPLSHSIRVIADAAVGLAHAHKLQDPLTGDAMSLVHRDVSPQNILVTYAGDAKVVDFGIAKAAHKVLQTRAGQLKGKYSYMSPEQALGEAVDYRTDIFALGVILYETTTGTRLFKRHNELATLQAVMKCEFVRPHEALPNYPPQLEAILLRALQKDPADRWQDGEAFSAALYDFLQDSGLFVEKEQIGAFMRDLFADTTEPERSGATAPDDGAPIDDDQTKVSLPPEASDASEDKEGPHSRPPIASAPAREGTLADRGRALETYASALSDEVVTDDGGDAEAEQTPDPEGAPRMTGGSSVVTPGFAASDIDSLIGQESTRSDTGPGVDAEDAVPERRRSTVIVRERLHTSPDSLSEAEDGVAAAPAPAYGDDAPTVAAVPTYRSAVPEIRAVAVEDPVDRSQTLPPKPTDHSPAGDPKPEPNLPVHSVPAYKAPEPALVPNTTPLARPKPDRTQQVRVRRSRDAFEDSVASPDPMHRTAPSPTMWTLPKSVLVLIGGLALVLVVLLTALVMRLALAPTEATGTAGQAFGQATLTVVTEPGAAVTLAGRRLGAADPEGQAGPFRVPSGVGMPLRVHSEALGFDRQRSLELKPNQNYYFEIRGRTGWLRLAVAPWARVTIDGKSMGLTPLPRIGLLEGVHRVRLENPDLDRVHETTVRIEAGREATVRVDLERTND